MSYAGPDELGRLLAVVEGGEVVEPWAACDHVVVDAGTLAAPQAVVDRLRSAWLARERLVVDVRVPFTARPSDVDSRPLDEVGPRARLLLDELHHLVWMNSVISSADGMRWPHADRALSLGASPAGSSGDVVLPDGRPCWLDGGRLEHRTGVLHRVALEHGSLVPFAGNESTAALAPDQLAAVTAVGATARIIAPAGSGKTRVLTERARHVVREWRLPPSAITLVAYNRRAQQEMEARLADVPGLQVRTLNSIALAILNGTAPFARRPRSVTTLGEHEVRDVLSRFVQAPRRRNVDPLAPWLEALSAARLGLRHADDVEDEYGGDVDGLSTVMEQFEGELDRRGAVDFDGQIVGAIRLLLNDPGSRRAAQRACRVLLVDEFQDLTPAHVLLVRLLAGTDGHVFGVGDDDQTIYGYNGADPTWLIEYGSLFVGAEDHPLQVNYRCPADVVEGVSMMLRRNSRRVPKEVHAAKAEARGLELVLTDDPVAATVSAIGATAPSEVAVLARVNAVLVPVQVALTAAGVPCTRVMGIEFMDRTAVRAALAWVRLATSDRFPADAVGEALRRPSRSISPGVATWVAKQGSMSALERVADQIESPNSAKAVRAFVADIEAARRVAATGTTVELLDEVFDVFGLASTLATFDANRRGMNAGSQSDDLLALRQLARMHPDPADFPAWLRRELSRPASDGGVTLATVHRVKGQEWPMVVVHLADSEQFPHRLAEDIAEERRLFHVALTRTSERVVVVATAATPSPFLRELVDEPSERDVVRPALAPAPAPRTKPARPLDVTTADSGTVERLRSLRTTLRGTKPAYTVFDDATLERIASAQPATLQELARIKGIGPMKLEQYGDAILAAVAG